MSRRRRSALEVAAIPERLMTVRRALEHHATSRALGAAAVLGVAALAYTLSAESPSAGSPSAPSAGSPIAGSPSAPSAERPLASSGTVPVKKMSVLDEPGLDNAVVVDPAGLRFIQGASIGGAQGASEAIYEWLGAGFAFPAEVTKKVTAVTMAAFHAYGTGPSAKHVIHVASPDLRGATFEEALKWLTEAYKNVFAEFKRHGAGRTLRLLPLSSGVFVGSFEKKIHELTARAFYAAGGAEIDNLVLCTFTSDPAPYITALAKFAPGLDPRLAPGLAPGLAPQTFREALDVLTKAYTAAVRGPKPMPQSNQVNGLTYAKFMSDLEARAKDDSGVETNPRAVTYGRAPAHRMRVPLTALAVAREEQGDAVTVCAKYAQNKKVGIMVAGNSGRPAGSVGRDDDVVCGKVHEGHKTQEESVVSSWMLGECGSAQTNCAEMGALFRRTIAARWGMVHVNGTDHETIQGVDYTSAKPEDYADAWVVRDAKLLVPETKGASSLQKTSATLVFVSGPNVGNGGTPTGTPTGSMQRTRNAKMAQDYALFLEGVKCAVRAGLDAMILEGVDVALVARISCGIYAGTRGSTFRTQINTIFLGLVNEILGEPLGHSKRGNYFQSVVVPMITTVATTRFV